MRIRTIKPDFFKHEAIADLPPLVRLLFVGLWCMADRRGRLEDRPRRIKVECLPFDECDIDAMLWDLHRAGFVDRYEVEGTAIIQVTSFEKHQRISGKESFAESEFPGKHSGSTREAPEKHPGSQERKGKERKGKEASAGTRTTSANWTPHQEHASIAALRGLNIDAQLARFRNRTGQDSDTDEGWSMRFTQWLGTGRPERGIAQIEAPKPRKPPKWAYSRDLESLQSKRREALFERNKYSPGTREFEEKNGPVSEIDAEIAELKEIGHE